ncbi:YheC/YheD family protein [Paenibacillus sp. SC116]|uniref:YheC/YheD family endospore coat-associated protein n=1 Tax=Paenibacillus sp. SC116 TaxID=2968986 RepID=UPI00215AADB5|nr:YheC/YheD family protein [Paenibacillus sp. SC116]MCR8843682.1 YheC/YheD family protein [Paenibacillus sp. SC116]
MAQPVLGILTLYLNEHKHLEERHIYQKMITAGQSIGLHVFVFTPQDVDHRKHRIYSMVYQHDKNRWLRQWTPFPDVIFDRCRLQNSSRFEQLRRFRKRYPDLLYLNKPLRNKWTVHQVLSEDSYLRQFLPQTKLYSSLADAQQVLKHHPLIYMKPINGTGGRGILRVERMAPTFMLYVQGRDQKRKIISPQRMTWSQLAARLNSWNATGRYIVQQGISLNLPNGRVHDYRMLVQKDETGNWTLTGCAGRIGAAKSITSNLHGGGEAISMDEMLRNWIGDDQLITDVKQEAEKMGIEAASYLERKYGALCELALDLAIDKNGKIWMLEVNPKPSREVFQLIGDQNTYQKSLIKPLQYALWLHQQRTLIRSNPEDLIPVEAVQDPQ